MAKSRVSSGGKTLYLELSVHPSGTTDPRKNLTISCPNSNTRFKTSLSDNGLKKFRTEVLHFHEEMVLGQQHPADSQ